MVLSLALLRCCVITLLRYRGAGAGAGAGVEAGAGAGAAGAATGGLLYFVTCCGRQTV